LTFRRYFLGFLLKYGVTEQKQRNPHASQQTNARVKEKQHNGNDRYMDKTVNYCNQNRWRIILHIADCCGDGGSQVSQAMAVKIAHRHILHPVAYMDAFIRAHKIANSCL